MIRGEEGFINRGRRLLRGLLRMAADVATRKITARQAYYQIQMRLFNKHKNLNDDFDWSKYHLYYREELKSVARGATLIPQSEDFEFSQGQILQKNMNIKPLHPNSHLLYELVLRLAPASVLEAGCGGGDHLRNLNMFNPQIKLFGIDRSEGQLATLRERHPGLVAELNVMDLTNIDTRLPVVDVIYSHAVLMHISETQSRFAIALDNIFKAAQSTVIMLENWREHDFLEAVKVAIKSNPSWANANIYFTYRLEFPNVRAMIVSKQPLPFEVLQTYDSLLQGQSMLIH